MSSSQREKIDPNAWELLKAFGFSDAALEDITVWEPLVKMLKLIVGADKRCLGPDCPCKDNPDGLEDSLKREKIGVLAVNPDDGFRILDPTGDGLIEYSPELGPEDTEQDETINSFGLKRRYNRF